MAQHEFPPPNDFFPPQQPEYYPQAPGQIPSWPPPYGGYPPPPHYPYGYGQYPPPPNPPVRSPSPRFTRNMVLILIGLTAFLVIICCGFMTAALSSDEIIIMMWLTSEDKDQLEALGIVCTDSVASDYTDTFVQNYGGQTIIQLPEVQSRGSSSYVAIGDIEYNGSTREYRATFTMGEESVFLGLGNCIQEIRQTEP